MVMDLMVAENRDLKRFLEAFSCVTEGMATDSKAIIFDIRGIESLCIAPALLIQEVAAEVGFNVKVLTVN